MGYPPLSHYFSSLIFIPLFPSLIFTPLFPSLIFTPLFPTLLSLPLTSPSPSHSSLYVILLRSVGLEETFLSYTYKLLIWDYDSSGFFLLALQLYLIRSVLHPKRKKKRKIYASFDQ